MTDLDNLLAPIAGDDPCGPDVEYNDEALELERALVVRPEAQYGERIYPPSEVDWEDVQHRAQALLTRSKDLRFAAAWLRAAVHRDGVLGLADGLRLAACLLDRYGKQLHPRAHPDDPEDEVLLLNSLRRIAEGEVLADIRATAVARGFDLTGRHIEVEFSPLLAGDSEPIGTFDALEELRRIAESAPQVLQALCEIHETAQWIARYGFDEAGAREGEFEHLLGLTQAFENAAQAVNASSAFIRPLRQPLRIESTHQALAQLDRIDAWLARTDPRHPARLLLRRARRIIWGDCCEPEVNEI
ncbi:type VI secretion system ImpA family N-terminal domain-containing protein [Piscinibacter sp. XHJ-5]|uniref:type VI secretion system protein TssA n=1 Tax=Piscinibacter sp. XHJ-5 TaxID=3037797 RepID=UPI0024528783|nr:type VI secretion system ImpA family N-terminal domain-containing protein [Piscinibacter sp. XHJ-5]